MYENYFSQKGEEGILIKRISKGVDFDKMNSNFTIIIDIQGATEIALR